MFTFSPAKFFSTHEIQSSKVLQRSFWLMLFLIFIDLVPFSERPRSGLASDAQGWDFVCWPHFESCSNLFLLEAQPLGVSYSLLMLFLMVCAGYAAVNALKSRWSHAQAGLGILVIYQFFNHFFLYQTREANFQYYSLPLMLVWVFLPRKLDLMRICFVMAYAFAASVKFDSSWIEGSYFTSLAGGLPLLPHEFGNITIPLVTNFVIYFEIFASFGLLAVNRSWQKWSFRGWIVFHLYSILLVGFYYPLHCLPMLYLLFSEGPPENPLRQKLPTSGLVFLAVIAVVNLTFPLISLFTQREHRYSLESFQYGLAMIDSNYQCRMEWEVVTTSGQNLGPRVEQSRNAMVRCPPSTSHAQFRRFCSKDPGVAAIRYRQDVSINGGPFYRIVDTENACSLEYSWLTPNDWIKTPAQGAPIVGYPSPNAIRSAHLLYPNGPKSIISPTPVPNPLRTEFSPWAVNALRIFDWCVWVAVGLFSLWRLWQTRKTEGGRRP